MKADLALLCDYAIVDQFGKLSVMGIWRQVMVQQFPAVHTRGHLVLQLRGRRTELGNHNLKVRLLDPQGTVLLEQTGSMQISEPPAGVVDLESPVVLVFDIPMTAPGEYHFEITMDGDQLADVPFVAAPVSGGHGQLN